MKTMRYLCLALSLVLAQDTFAAPPQATIPSPGPIEANKYPIATAIVGDGVTVATRGMQGWKSFYGEVECSSGACTQTQAIYGDIDGDAANGVLLCTITLSGNPRHQDACPPIAANFIYYYVVITNTTGTTATGAVYAIH